MPDKHPIDRLRENLAHFNAQAEDLGSGLEGATAWRFASRLFHDIRRALEEVEAAGTDTEIEAVEGALVAGAEVLLAVTAMPEGDVPDDLAKGAQALGQAMRGLAFVFGFGGPEGDETEGEQEEEDSPAESVPVNGTTA